MTQFPALPLEAWENSKITLHLWLQIVGKIKLDLMPKRNHWWHITLHLSPKGLTTGPIPYQSGSFQIDFNLREHLLEIHTSWGEDRSFPLADGLSVSNFHKQLFDALDELNIKTKIVGAPYDHPCTEPFDECESHSNYDPVYVNKFWNVLIQVDSIFKEFSGRFYGKVSPSQLYWHHMDLAVTRFSGDKGPKLGEGSTNADKEAYSHEVISAGFWAGDENVRGAAFYSYTYPSPEGIDEEPLLPKTANWVDSNGSPMAVLMYDDLLKEEDPRKALLDFLQSSFDAGAKKAQWSEDLLNPNFN
ncbi:MAG: hypothetical protein HRT61_08880 [Ekhidna sp.]|nr:hypothetical protein [Ekhidna sp.]